MPRKPRISSPGALHHVMSRGIEGRSIFIDDQDRQVFLNLLSSNLGKIGFKCYAWALLENHYHLLLRASERHMSELMRPLNGNYARYFGKKYNRRGYLFQDRYRSIATQDQVYAEEILRYIHLNPVRSMLCRNLRQLDSYRWCGHATLMGNRECKFQNTRDVLRKFSRYNNEARRLYRNFMEQGLGKNNDEEDDVIAMIRRSNSGAQVYSDTGCWVIGNREFVERVLDNDKQKRLRLSRFAREGWTVARIAAMVADAMAIPEAKIRQRSRLSASSYCRKAVAYLAHHEMGITCADIAEYLGVKAPAVSMMLAKGKHIVEKRNLNKLIN